MCVHATQGMYIVLSHTWSGSSAYCIPPRVPCTVYRPHLYKDQQLPAAMDRPC